ncbi:hypothetical protein [Cohnella luojiensis]|nr:hypothetical protein [Cohnella luojiensis]
MQPIQARFATQDQAESAMRKLASLRSDRFRLERVINGFGSSYASDQAGAIQSSDVDGLTASLLAGSAFQSSSGVMASADAVANQWDATTEGSGPVSEFTLSANVPGEAAEQARTVIEQAGGQIV